MKYSEFLKLKAEVDCMTVDREQQKFPAASALWYDWQWRIQTAKRKSFSKLARQRYWDWVLERLSRSERVADFGCGCGGFAKFAIMSGKKFVLGVDFSSTAIAQARQLNQSHAACFRCEDLSTSRTLRRAKYDTAVFTEVLEHVADDLAILSRVPSGRRILLSVPSFSARGHCRWFSSLEAAEHHYVKYLRVTRSESLPFRKTEHWWLFDGVRR